MYHRNMEIYRNIVSGIARLAATAWNRRKAVTKFLQPAKTARRAGLPEIVFPASSITLSALAVVILLPAACAAVTEAERDETNYAREDRLLEAKDDFHARAVECSKNGGTMQIKKYSSSGLTNRDAHAYRTAECVKF